MSSNQSRLKRLALWVCVLLFCIWAWIITLKYYHFNYFGWDLSLYAQLMWNLSHGRAQTSLFGGNFLVDHANYAAFLLTPFYFFFQNALTLLYFKLFAFWTGTYIFYLIISKKIEGWWPLLLMLGYAFYPANLTMLFFEFNFEDLTLPLIMLAFYFIEERRFRAFFLTGLLLMTVKENMPLIVMGLGLYACLRHRTSLDKRLMTVLIVGGIGVFLIQIIVIQPWLMKDNAFFHHSNYWNFYNAFGKTPPEILKNMIMRPMDTLGIILEKQRLSYLAELFGPLILLALLSPLIVLIALPLFLQHLLSNFWGQHAIAFYYSSALTVFIFLAAVNTLSKFKNKMKERMLAVTVLSLMIFNCCYVHEWKGRLAWRDDAYAAVRYWMLSKIPPGEGVISSYNFLPFLSQRKELYVLGRKKISFTQKREVIPGHVSYMIIDFSSIIPSRETIAKKVRDEKWVVDSTIDRVVLFRRYPPNIH